MTDTRARARVAHRKTVEFDVAHIARYLQDMLGQKLVAHMTGVTDSKTVGHWAGGQQHPRPESEARLRVAFQVFHLLLDAENDHSVRAWFIGMNPQLDDEAPADAIRDGRGKDVLVAARAYIAGG